MAHGKVAAMVKVLAVMAVISVLCNCAYGGEAVRYGTASFYGLDAKKERLNEYTASGKRFNPQEAGLASWDYAFGTTVVVTNLDNGKSVECVVTDRGPAKRLVKQGRIVDLYRGCFEQIADLREGLINVSIRVLDT